MQANLVKNCFEGHLTMPRMKLEGSSSIVTGGASGIGAACARQLAAAGSKVVIADLNEQGFTDLTFSFAEEGTGDDQKTRDEPESGTSGTSVTTVHLDTTTSPIRDRRSRRRDAATSTLAACLTSSPTRHAIVLRSSP